MTPSRDTAGMERRIFLIATEESGDRLGANLMKVLRQRLGDAVQFEGIGGRAMAREGLESLFPIEELSIIGLAAVVKDLPKILGQAEDQPILLGHPVAEIAEHLVAHGRGLVRLAPGARDLGRDHDE